jgi:preprotein translocase subunit SecG
MNTLVTVVHVVVCVFLILVILLQAGKGGSGGLGFGMSGSQTVFGGRGSQTFLGKVTSACAAIFFSTCIILSFMTSHGSVPARAAREVDGGVASVGETTAADASAAPAPAPAPEGMAASPDGGGVVIPAAPQEQPKP